MMESSKRTPLGIILLAWLVVCIPLGWGVYNTLLNSMKLFHEMPMRMSKPAAPTK